jgi:uncharacterized caspase-like protein
MRRTIVSRSVRSGHGDFDERALPPNTLIAYAQKAGQTAEDGEGSNSPYTTALLKHLSTPGLDVELALRRVRDEVLKAHQRQLGAAERAVLVRLLAIVRRRASVSNGRNATESLRLHIAGRPSNRR